MFGFNKTQAPVSGKLYKPISQNSISCFVTTLNFAPDSLTRHLGWADHISASCWRFVAAVKLSKPRPVTHQMTHSSGLILHNNWACETDKTGHCYETYSAVSGNKCLLATLLFIQDYPGVWWKDDGCRKKIKQTVNKLKLANDRMKNSNFRWESTSINHMECITR